MENAEQAGCEIVRVSESNPSKGDSTLLWFFLIVVGLVCLISFTSSSGSKIKSEDYRLAKEMYPSLTPKQYLMGRGLVPVQVPLLLDSYAMVDGGVKWVSAEEAKRDQHLPKAPTLTMAEIRRLANSPAPEDHRLLRGTAQKWNEYQLFSVVMSAAVMDNEEEAEKIMNIIDEKMWDEWKHRELNPDSTAEKLLRDAS